MFDFDSHPRPNHSWSKTIIYELHIGGFTKHPSSKVDPLKQGTFLGLIKKLKYLKSLGISSIELLPVYSFDKSDAPHGLDNYWGYSPINWFTPHWAFVMGGNPLKARNQFRELVSACHDLGIEVILDVVYNHTTEGNINGPIISWKGFGENFYYHQNDDGDFLDVTGCGNSIAANRPLVRQLILESMKCWANELGVDGFRFDLGVALSRGEGLTPLENPPLFEEIEADPSLSGLKLISEPWDCGGLYLLSNFPAKRISTWNGNFRDNIRKFWKGDTNSVWPIKDSLRGNNQLYNGQEERMLNSINFITSHDGFTLTDLVSFNIKHNLSNGENNRDGENHNNSFNHGVEGPTSNKDLKRLRNRQKKNFFSTMLLSPGVPMLLMGDEVGRSQGGNNNTWCQDNSLSWMLWEGNDYDLELYNFVQELIRIRKKIPELFDPLIPTNESSSKQKQVSKPFWVQWHGVNASKPDWSDWSHTLAYSINQGSNGAVMWLGLNAYEKAMTFELPSPMSSWVGILNTSSKQCPKTIQTTIELKKNSFMLLLCKEYSSKIKS